MNILILEDDIPLCQGIELTLKDGSRIFTLCHDISSARQALKSGAFDLLILDINLPDDYITKPFSLSVLRARVNALLRRGTTGMGSRIIINNFCFDFENLQFSKDGALLELSKTEQRLLHLLLSNKGHTLSREKLLKRIWPDGSDYVDENALSVAIRRLRAKLEDKPSNPEYIKTVYGIGYTWAVNE